MLEVAKAVGFEQDNGRNFNHAVPLPLGAELALHEGRNQAQLPLNLDAFANRMRRVFGYAGGILLTESQGGAFPPLLSCV